MARDIFDNELDDQFEDLQHECPECGTIVDNEDELCSYDCFKASLL